MLISRSLDEGGFKPVSRGKTSYKNFLLAKTDKKNKCAKIALFQCDQNKSREESWHLSAGSFDQKS
jgi:hypothetical protein